MSMIGRENYGHNGECHKGGNSKENKIFLRFISRESESYELTNMKTFFHTLTSKLKAILVSPCRLM